MFLLIMTTNLKPVCIRLHICAKDKRDKMLPFCDTAEQLHLKVIDRLFFVLY